MRFPVLRKCGWVIGFTRHGLWVVSECDLLLSSLLVRCVVVCFASMMSLDDVICSASSTLVGVLCANYAML